MTTNASAWRTMIEREIAGRFGAQASEIRKPGGVQGPVRVSALIEPPSGLVGV
jgi:hypothetical protein